jgi:hypothetical protein
MHTCCIIPLNNPSIYVTRPLNLYSFLLLVFFVSWRYHDLDFLSQFFVAYLDLLSGYFFVLMILYSTHDKSFSLHA